MLQCQKQGWICSAVSAGIFPTFANRHCDCVAWSTKTSEILERQAIIWKIQLQNTPHFFSTQASNRAAASSVWCRKCSISSSGEGCNIWPPWVQWKVPRLHSYGHKSLGLLNRVVLRKNVSSQLTSFLPCQCGAFVQIGMCQQDCNRVLSLNHKGLRSDLIYIVSTYP